MTKNMLRVKVLDFLQWNDRQGCYTDENCRLEGVESLSYEDAVKFFFGVMNEDFYYARVDNIFELTYEEVIDYAKENGFYESTMEKLNQLLESERLDEALYNKLLSSSGTSAEIDSIIRDIDFQPLIQKLTSVSNIGSELSKILQPKVEAYTKLIDMISEFSQPISESLKQLTLFLEGIDSLSWGIDFDYAQFTDNQKLLAQRMIRNGWYFTSNLPLVSHELLSANDKDFNLSLYHFYDNESKDMFKRVLEAFPQRKHILTKIRKAHNDQDYELCIPAMLAQADGISYELFNVSLFSKDNLKQPKTKNQTQIKFDENDIMDILFITQLSITGNLNETVFTTPKFFNRHSVLHGKDIHYNKKQNSLRCLSMLYFLAEVKERKDELNRIK